MFNQIMDLVKGKVTDMLGDNADIPEDKKEQAIETTTSSLVDGLKKYATPENISKLTSMLGIGKSEAGVSIPAASGNMAGGLEANVVSALTSKVGLSQSVAKKIATTVIPAVMSLFKTKVNDDNEPGFNLQSLVGGIMGKTGSEAHSAGGGLMDMIGGFLGKK